MLSFFKQKPVLKDLIPNNFVDIHSHLLPGIDDGAKTIDDTRNLILELKSFGYNHFITTPHIITNVWKNNETSIENHYNSINAELEKEGLFSSFNVAAEYMIDSFFMKRLETEKLLTLKDNYVLIEMSYLNPPIQLYDIIFEIQLTGYTPVLAHPERYTFYHHNFSEYEKLKKTGCLFQLNLLSTVDYYGKNISSVADKLLQKGMIDFVGSDVHHANHIQSFYKKVSIKNTDALKVAMDKNLFFLP